MDNRLHKSLEGQTFGYVTLIERLENRGKLRNRITYLGRCSLCNETKIFELTSIRKAEREGRVFSCKCQYKKPEGYSAKRGLYGDYKNNAKSRNKEFTLSFEEFIEITSKDCEYCDRPPIMDAMSRIRRRNNGGYLYNGIDRVDNDKGYTLENSVPCCKICNIAKHAMTKEEFFEWIERVYNKCISKQLVN